MNYNAMKTIRLIISIVFLVILFSSCTKFTSNGTGSRTDSTHPEGITLDTTWHNDTIIPF